MTVEPFVGRAMIRCVCLGLVLAALLAGASADPAPRSAENEVTWSDTFKDGEAKGYQLVAGVTRDKRRGVVMGANSILVREVPLGFEAEVDVAFPEALGEGRGILLSLRGGHDIAFINTTLRLDKGKPVLVVWALPVASFPLDGPGIDPEGPWTLKVHVRHGVVRAKAWPAGKAEPKDWQVTRYTGSSGWEPRVLTVLPGAGEAAHVTRLAVRGSKPATALYLKSDEPGAAEKKQVVELARQTTTLLKQAEFVKALEAARGCVEASKKAFGPDHAFTATCVNNLGGALHAAGKYDDALKAFEEGGAAGRRGAPPRPRGRRRCSARRSARTRGCAATWP